MKIFTSSVMVVILATLLFSGRLFDVSPVETLRLKTFDYYQKISPRDVTTNSVVIVEITEQDLKKYGQWPWPRNLIANLHCTHVKLCRNLYKVSVFLVRVTSHSCSNLQDVTNLRCFLTSSKKMFIA